MRGKLLRPRSKPDESMDSWRAETVVIAMREDFPSGDGRQYRSTDRDWDRPPKVPCLSSSRPPR